MVKNQGQVPQYYVEDSHPAIVSPELFELVQQEIAKNSLLGTGRSNASPFSGKIICADCGEYFSPKTWHSKDAYKKRVWQCGGKYRNRTAPKCQTPHLSEEQLEAVFLEAINQILADRDRYIANLEPVIAYLTDTAELEKEAEVLAERSAGLYAQLEALVEENARFRQDQSEYKAKYSEINRRYEAVKARLGEIAAERQKRMAKREAIAGFLETVCQRESLITAFDEGLWRATVEAVTVRSLTDIRVKFRDGREIKVSL